MALSEVRDARDCNLIVFVQAESDVGDAEAAFLEGLGVGGVIKGQQMFTATLSAEGVDGLSEQSWVRSIRLSQRLGFRKF